MNNVPPVKDQFRYCVTDDGRGAVVRRFLVGRSDLGWRLATVSEERGYCPSPL